MAGLVAAIDVFGLPYFRAWTRDERGYDGD